MKRHMFTVATLLLSSSSAFTQSPPKFEIADVHASPHRVFPLMQTQIHDGRYVVRQATMVDLIASAYDLDPNLVQGGPTWLEMNRFDIIAKIPPETSRASVKLMLRALLADRFHLVLKPGTRPVPAFLLTKGPGPLKMKPAEGGKEADCQYQKPHEPPSPGRTPSIAFACHQITTDTLAKRLHQWGNGYLSDPVIDQTGLQGSWDFDIHWTPRQFLQKAGNDGVSLFDAVDKQLGLKLDHQSAPLPVQIVDSVDERPTPSPPDLAKILPPLAPAQFDVATIKPSKPDAKSFASLRGGTINAEGMNLRFFIPFAWDLNPNDEEMLIGAPKWIDSDRFDIQAKVVDVGTPNSDPNGIDLDLEDLRHMLQDLIAERFKMKSHMENRPVTAYSLVAEKPKLTKADPLSRTRCKEGPGPDGKDPRIATPTLNRLISCQNMTMAQFGEQLQGIASGYIYGPVLDKTGITGAWDFTLSFSSAELTRGNNPGNPPPQGGASDPNGALSLFEAVSKQLGLKLEKERRPVPVLVIDHIEEKPTEN
jgi:uncharacterized protein (TIGR03435 family)